MLRNRKKIVQGNIYILYDSICSFHLWHFPSCHLVMIIAIVFYVLKFLNVFKSFKSSGLEYHLLIILILCYFRIAPSLLWKPDVALYNKQDLSKRDPCSRPQELKHQRTALFQRKHSLDSPCVSQGGLFVIRLLNWLMKALARYCARVSPTATGPGAPRCVTSASAPGLMTAQISTSTFMMTWWVITWSGWISLISRPITFQG